MCHLYQLSFFFMAGSCPIALGMLTVGWKLASLELLIALGILTVGWKLASLELL